ncbi:Rab7a, partial [Symbiodinium sp. KB8]
MAHGMASLVGWGSPLPIYCDQQRRQSFYDPQLLQWSFYAKTGRAPAASEAAAPSSEVHSRLESEQFENAVGQIFATSGLDVQSNMYYDGAGTRQEGTFALHEARKFLFQRHLEKNQKAETAQSAWEVHSEQLCAGGFLSFLRVANAWMRNNILEQAPPQPLGRKGEKLYEVDVVVTKPMTWQESEDLPPVCFIENGESGRREFTLATFMRSCLQQTTFIEVTFESQLRDRKLRQFEFHKVLQEHKPNSGSLLLYNGSEFCAAPSRLHKPTEFAEKKQNRLHKPTEWLRKPTEFAEKKQNRLHKPTEWLRNPTEFAEKKQNRLRKPREFAEKQQNSAEKTLSRLYSKSRK